jgi:hypothetical protein
LRLADYVNEGRRLNDDASVSPVRTRRSAGVL